MNYLTDFTKEEIKYVCTVIPYQETASHFRRYPKEFTKLKPGFRAKSLNEDMVIRILYEFHTRDFIASYLIEHIDKWLEEIDEELVKTKEKGLDQEGAYINVLSRSSFAKNIPLFFKIKGEEKSEDFLAVLNSAVLYETDRRKEDEEELDFIKKKMARLVEKQDKFKQQIADEQKRTEDQKKREHELNEKLEQASQAFDDEQEKCRQASARVERLEIELKTAKEDEVWKSSEMQQKIDALAKRLEEQAKQSEEYSATLSELKSKLSSAEEDIQTWKNQVRNREKQLFTFKAERAALLTDKDGNKKQIKELKEALEQALSFQEAYKEQLASIRVETVSQMAGTKIKETFEEQEHIQTAAESVAKRYSDSERHVPLCPEDMEDFDEYFSYNLENIGFDQNEDGLVDFLYYLEKVFFHGIPLLIKRGAGINLANLLSNTLCGVPVSARLLYSEGANIQKISEFLSDMQDRVVCIDGFIGNCNVMELLPVLEQHRNKIIILTYMFDRTLTFVPNEILSYVHFISADEFSSLSRIKDITEDPSEIKERPFVYKGTKNPNFRLQKIFRDIACECGVEASAASTMAEMIEDENHLNEMLMFTLLPYVQKVLGKNPYNCSKRLQRYAGEAGRCLKKDIMMRWFG